MTEPETENNITVEEQAQQWLLRMTSRDVTDEVLVNFERWYKSEYSHKSAYDELRQLWDGIDELREFGPSEQINSKQRSVSETSPTAVRYYALICSGLVVASLLITTFKTELTDFIYADYRTAVGEQRSINLPDGSIAHLNTNSAIAVNYSNRQHKIRLLRGEVLFEAIKNGQNIPFEVLSLGGDIVSMGSSFIVRQKLERTNIVAIKGNTDIIYYRADSKLSPGDNVFATQNIFPAASDHRMSLNAGEEVSYQKGTPPSIMYSVDIARKINWHKGAILIDNLPFKQALTEINRYYAGHILLLADESDFATISTEISLESLEDELERLASTQGLTVTTLMNYFILLH
ncbi:MAG: hypothetical protein COA90_04650 [Gammaproteobacteria bacterium]|nr:MAG: hypothetical protein COA90_04650 [Gammaproteobacteria bacterium]